ncbi:MULTISPECIES: hypothetical protein [unclassified Streptomyces]|uniref:hypothetical protein n=1 Tax=unclassified Streptomyces TaxID=2593676 RepID=UPI0011B0E6CA|nr:MULTISPECIES: hypothetical protein [unclassified Streptomyces]
MGESMNAWAEVGWGVVFGTAALMVTFNYRDVAWRIHGFMANTVGVNRLLTPAMVRFTCGVLAIASMVSVVVGPARP